MREAPTIAKQTNKQTEISGIELMHKEKSTTTKTPLSSS
jgi:hypothetical protein